MLSLGLDRSQGVRPPEIAVEFSLAVRLAGRRPGSATDLAKPGTAMRMEFVDRLAVEDSEVVPGLGG